MYRFLRGSSIAFAAAACLAVPVSLAGDDVSVPFTVSGKTTVRVDAKLTPSEGQKPQAVTDTAVAESGADGSAPEIPDIAAEADSVDVSLAGPPSVGSGDFVIVAIAQATPGAELTFGYDPDPGSARRAVFEEPGTGRRLIVFIQPPAARYRISLIGQIVTDGRDPFDVAVHDVTVGKVTPPTPDPDVDPVPPDPDPEPTPDTAPFPADGLHVLIVYESSKMNGLTPEQRAIIQGVDVRAALNEAAPDRYRIYDQNADLTYVPPVWKTAMAVPREMLPWLVISNGKTGYNGPLNMTAAEFKQLLSEFK